MKRGRFLGPAFASRRLVFLALAVVLFVVAQLLTERKGLRQAEEELSVVLPMGLQLAAAAGDRYLAANLAIIRAIIVGAHRLRPETYRALGRIQLQGAWLNPVHEDNYYIAAAILPWEGEVAATQSILEQATAARRWDFMPPFLLGFNRMHFERDPAGGAAAARLAAERSPANRASLNLMASSWYAKGADYEHALTMLDHLSRDLTDPRTKEVIEKRKQRISTMAEIKRAVDTFRVANGRIPSVDELLTAGLLNRIPTGPWGERFVVDAGGVPRVAP